MSYEKVDVLDSSNWRLTKFLLSTFGAWPFQSLRLQKVIRSISFIVVVSILIPEIVRLFTVRKDSNLVIDCVPLFVLHLLSFINMLQCFTSTSKMRKLLVQIRKDWQSDLSSSEAKILRSDSQQTRIIVHIYMYFIYAVTGMYMSTPMIPKILDYILPLNESRPKIALYQTEFLVDSEKYETPILLHAYIITPFPSTVIIAFDALYANCVHHGCSMFAIVGYRFKYILNDKNKQNVQINRENDGNNYHSYSFAECIAKHKEVLEYARLLESTYAPCMMAILAINTLAMSITGLQTILKLNEPIEVVRFGMYTISQIVHLSFLSWPSQKLMDESEQVLYSIYEGEWYILPPKHRRHHVFVMMMGCKPCKLTAGKIYTMSLQSFGSVVKTSMSYCTVLLSMQ